MIHVYGCLTLLLGCLYYGFCFDAMFWICVLTVLCWVVLVVLFVFWGFVAWGVWRFCLPDSGILNLVCCEFVLYLIRWLGVVIWMELGYVLVN